MANEGLHAEVQTKNANKVNIMGTWGPTTESRTLPFAEKKSLGLTRKQVPGLLN